MNVKKIIGLFMMIPLVLILTTWFVTPMFLSDFVCDSLTFKLILEILILLFCLYYFIVGIRKVIGDKYD